MARRHSTTPADARGGLSRASVRRRILDTQFLIAHWLGCRRQTEDASVEVAERWAADLVATYSTDAIVTPVCIEFVAGAQNREELDLKRAYLARLRVVDKGTILDRDWVEGRRLAERVPVDGKPRQLGDGLIKAIANRLAYEVFSHDQRFPR